MSLEENTNMFKEKVADAEGFSDTVKIDFKGEGVIFVDGSTTPPTVSNDDNEADVTLIISEDDFAGLLDGSLNPQMAFMMGKLKIEGDMGLAMKLAQMF